LHQLSGILEQEEGYKSRSRFQVEIGVIGISAFAGYRPLSGLLPFVTLPTTGQRQDRSR
jgi:hypothetical protein